MLTCIHTYIHTCIGERIFRVAELVADQTPYRMIIKAAKYLYAGVYIHTYMHTYMHTYIHTCAHTYMCSRVKDMVIC